VPVRKKTVSIAVLAYLALNEGFSGVSACSIVVKDSYIEVKAVHI
jgi:hypothetical protein